MTLPSLLPFHTAFRPLYNYWFVGLSSPERRNGECMENRATEPPNDTTSGMGRGDDTADSTVKGSAASVQVEGERGEEL